MGSTLVNISTSWQDHPPGDGTTGYELRLHRAAGAGAISGAWSLGSTEADRQSWRDLADAGGTSWSSAIVGLIGATTWGILDTDERDRIRAAVRRSA